MSLFAACWGEQIASMFSGKLFPEQTSSLHSFGAKKKKKKREFLKFHFILLHLQFLLS